MAALLGLAVWTPAPAMAADVSVTSWDNVPAMTGSGKPASAEEIKRAFMVGGTRRGWTFTDAGPGKLTCTLVVRRHTLVMNLAYEDGKYSLGYKDSTNLNYDKADNTIHSNYNGWIQNLQNAIITQTSTM